MKEMEKPERKLISVYGYLFIYLLTYLFIYLFILFSFWLKNALSRLVKKCKCYLKKTRIPRKASSHLLGQKSKEPQSKRGY